MDGEKSGDKVGKASLPTKGKGEKGLQSSIKNVNREKSKERSAHSSSHSEAVKSKEKALDCGDRNETGTRSWTSKSKVVSLSTKQTGSCGLSSACLQPGVSALQRKNINRMGKSCNQRNVPSHCNENTDGGDSSGRGEREVFSTDDITAHLRRLTEEHGKLQSEYARVRILLQDACIRLKHNDANAGVAVESTEGAKTGSDSSINQMEDSVSPLESDKGTFEGNDDDRGESTEVIKEHFRKEVLRLKESLLTSQQQVCLGSH